MPRIRRLYRHAGWLALSLMFASGALRAADTQSDAPAGATVERIEVTLGSATIGARSDEKYTLTRNGAEYSLRGDISEVEERYPDPRETTHSMVEGNRRAADVSALLDALEAKPVARDRALGILANSAAVQATLRQGNDDPGLDGCPEATSVLARPLRDPAAIRPALAEYYKGGWTDDGASFELTLRLPGGKELKASTHAQATPTLPWTVDGVETWNAAIPRALAALLPSWSPMGQRMISQPNARTVLSHLLPSYQEALGDALYRCTSAHSKHQIASRTAFSVLYNVARDRPSSWAMYVAA